MAALNIGHTDQDPNFGLEKIYSTVVRPENNFLNWLSDQKIKMLPGGVIGNTAEFGSAFPGSTPGWAAMCHIGCVAYKP